MVHYRRIYIRAIKPECEIEFEVISVNVTPKTGEKVVEAGEANIGDALTNSAIFETLKWNCSLYKLDNNIYCTDMQDQLYCVLLYEEMPTRESPHSDLAGH